MPDGHPKDETRVTSRHTPIPADLATRPFDVIVIGAGVNGAGIARDAALRGMRALLVDKGDLGGGTTSWSSRLIHGGLRYLEHAEIGLVRESLRERERLLRIAPHLVKPLPLLIPIYADDRRGPLLIRAGMIAYDLLSFDKSLDRHRMLSRDEALRRAPGLNPEGLRGAAVYYDAQVEYAERLAVENALAARDLGATLLTHARVNRLLVEGGAAHGIECVDELDATAAPVIAHARAIVNVAGPWVDRVLRGTDGVAPPEPLIGGTKGSHIVVAPFAGAPADALYVEARADGRPYFILPWNGLYLIGTTDSRYRGNLDRVEADESEIGYLIAETNRVIPTAGLDRGDVLYSYAGVRPLPFQPDGREGAITRRHIVHDHAKNGGPRGLFSIVGGKLTTYRSLAEHAVDAVQRRNGASPTPSRTGRVPLPGGGSTSGERLAAYRTRFLADTSLPLSTAERLVRLYGVRAGMVATLAAETPDLAVPLLPHETAIRAEIVHAVRHEAAETLADILLRRTMLGLGANAGIGPDEAAARVAIDHLGWSSDRAAAEVAAYRDYVKRFHPRALSASLERSTITIPVAC